MPDETKQWIQANAWDANDWPYAAATLDEDDAEELAAIRADEAAWAEHLQKLAATEGGTDD